ncbi:PEGA domain-containing protein, partial [Candidatus Roizmanbacteria bacterium]|nr:PEGA domain-containing protein [Candidatus Roizmanbacteria bacterium]
RTNAADAGATALITHGGEYHPVSPYEEITVTFDIKDIGDNQFDSGVFIDNLPVGKTPYEAKYKAGDYMLKLIPEGEASQTATWQGKITVYKNAWTYVNRELGSSDVTSAGEIFSVTRMDKDPKDPNYGEIQVETDPNGAIVYLDNDEKGVSPLILADVMKGDHELSITMPGFFKRTQKVNVDPKYRVLTSFKLALDEHAQKLPDQTAQTSSPSAQVKTSSSVLIKETPTGWLRVRAEPSVDASESAKVNPGEKYSLLEEKTGWYHIQLKGMDGWISSQYAEKQ